MMEYVELVYEDFEDKIEALAGAEGEETWVVLSREIRKVRTDALKAGKRLHVIVTTCTRLDEEMHHLFGSKTIMEQADKITVCCDGMERIVKNRNYAIDTEWRKSA